MKYTNHFISYFVTRLNYGLKKRLRFIKLEINDTILCLLKIFYLNGVIRSYKLHSNNIVDIYLKYYKCNPAMKIKFISTPGNRVYWSLNNLLRAHNNNSFVGFYILSTQKGIYTSNYCLLNGFTGGEVLIRVEV